MNKRSRCILLFPCFVTLFAGLWGCGSMDPDQESQILPTNGPVLSCDDLELQDPKTGGIFACIGCRRQWEWQLSGNENSPHFLIHLSCGATSGAFLRILNPFGETAWETEIRTGDLMEFCVPLDNPNSGTYTVELCGSPPLRLTSFTGSVWINLYDQKGEILSPTNTASFRNMEVLQ